MMLSLSLALLGAVAASAGAEENPLALAESGSVQCFEPDDEKKTCRSIAAYRPLGEGRYETVSTVLISRASSMTLETVTPVEVKKGAVCGLVTAEEVANGKLRLADRLLAPDEARPYLETLQKSLKALIGKEICTSYAGAPGGLLAKVLVDGVYRAGTDERVKWIGPNEAYSVSP